MKERKLIIIKRSYHRPVRRDPRKSKSLSKMVVLKCQRCGRTFEAQRSAMNMYRNRWCPECRRKRYPE